MLVRGKHFDQHTFLMTTPILIDEVQPADSEGTFTWLPWPSQELHFKIWLGLCNAR